MADQLFHKTEYQVQQLVDMTNKGELGLPDLQRGFVWKPNKIRDLLDSMMKGYPIGFVMLWAAQSNTAKGENKVIGKDDKISYGQDYVIIDGQQRIKAISSFIDNDYKLKSQYLLDEEIKEKYGNKFFKDLDPEVKTAFWNYRLMIIEISQESTKEEIVQVFRRLNLTDFNLNDQEKRNSISGDFAALARDLSENEIWEEKHLFNNTDIKRMKDVEFCGTLILLYRQGIIDQTDQKPLNQAYEDLQTGYTDAENDKQHICDAIIELRKFIEDDEILKFVKRKAQLYTVFSVIFYLQREDENVTDVHVEKLKNFVKLYSVFDNDMDMDGKLSDEEKNIYDMLKKYKLASSEGLNKHTNRMIRYNVLKDFLCDKKNTDDIQAGLYDKIVNYVEER